jgi:plasmid stabilization system protein ParE
MKKFDIKLSSDALEDIEQLENIIVVQYKAPLTAVRYIQGLKDTIKLLANYPEAFPFNASKSLQKYGPFSRHIDYKQITILFSVFKGTVYIHRIVPSKSIT